MDDAGTRKVTPHKATHAVPRPNDGDRADYVCESHEANNELPRPRNGRCDVRCSGRHDSSASPAQPTAANEPFRQEAGAFASATPS